MYRALRGYILGMDGMEIYWVWMVWSYIIILSYRLNLLSLQVAMVFNQVVDTTKTAIKFDEVTRYNN